jgi:pimeloyl-ACP methyl ester carboxylesterase
MILGEAIRREINTMHVAIRSVIAGTAIVMCSSIADAADVQSAVTPVVKCEALVDLSFPGTTIVIEKAEAVPEAPPGTLQVRPPSPETVQVTLPPNCRAQGVIDRRVGDDGKKYAIGFAIALPDHWNGRFLFQGGGALNGSIRSPLGPQATGDTPALARGFAVVTTDSGHQGQAFDASFMQDQEAALNFAHGSVGSVTAAAKAIIARYYGQGPARSYFVGCSTGGREGMLASQRYPEAFDGIVAGAPAMRTGRSNLGLAWANYNFTQIAPKGDDGKPRPDKAFSPADRKLVADAIVAACDAKDGLKDGMIFNTRQCQFDPASLACGGTKTNACLAAGQVSALAKAFAGPKNSRGAQSYSAFPWDSGVAAESVQIPGILTTGARGPVSPPFLETINVDAIEDRLNADGMDRLQGTAYWTNLNSFFAHGGKILFYHGVSDPWFSALDTVDYYERMARSSGGLEQVRANSSRAFLVPGMGHCTTGAATLDRFDLLQAVVDWVEQGKAPDQVTATGPAFPGRSRPLCAYPQYAAYKGEGNPEDAASFACRN